VLRTECKRWSGPPFVARQGEELIVYSLIVVGLYYKGLGHSTEFPGSPKDLGSCRCAVARHVALGWACLFVVTSLIRCSEGHMSRRSLLIELILDSTTYS
jgi:hypothetical protein